MTEKLIKLLQDKLAAANAKASEWEGKEDQMPTEVASEIHGLIQEAEKLKEQLIVAKKHASLSSFLEDGKGPKTNLPAEDKPEPTMGFKSLGEQLVAVKNAANPTLRVDPRLVSVKAAGMYEGVATEGGHLLQEDFAADLLKRTYEQGEILSRVRRFPISASSNRLSTITLSEESRKDGSRWSGILAYWKPEAAEKIKSALKFGKITLELKKLIGLCYATDELLQDAPALEGIISWAFQEEFTFQLEGAIVGGPGTDQPLGFMNSPALVTVPKVTGQAADTILAENIFEMWSRMWAPSRRNAIWLINQDVEPQLFNLYVTATAGAVTGFIPVYLPANGISASPFGTLMGRPVIPSEHMQTLGDKGDIALVDLSQYWTIDKGTMQQASSIHVNFVTDETAFRFVYRIDGQPSWPSALTPKNGTKTLSPFVTLDARA
jgi:HK97 family phage major capsid protein